MSEVRQKKKKVDYVALNSPFMKIPRMDVKSARYLLDLRFKEIYELKGRSPEALLDDLKKIKVEIPVETLSKFSLAVEFAENT